MDKTKHRDVCIVSGQEALKMAAHPRYRHTTVIGDPSNDLYEVTMAKRTTRFNIPIQLAVSILNLAKIELNRFGYGFVLRYFGDRVNIILTDTGKPKPFCLFCFLINNFLAFQIRAVSHAASQSWTML